MRRKLLSILALLMIAVSGAWAGTQATGYFESCTAYHGSIRVKGWAYDPDQPATSIQVHAYIWYGPSVGTTKEERLPAVGINANIERSDVNEAKGITGAHGFDQYIAVPAGTYTVQVYAIDKTGDGNPKIPGTSGNPATYTVTVTAPYNITYDANGGSGAPAAQQKGEHVNINLSGAKPTRDGYIFTGWNTAQDGSGDSYAPGAAYTADGDATLYAQWEPIVVVDSGTSGDVSWTLTSDGVMTISGTGAMADYNGYDYPWYSKSDYITSVVIEEGVTTIGKCAFFDCYNLASVSIPASVTSIGASAFSNCGKTATTLTVTIADGSALTTIGSGAFWKTKLTSITLPASVTSIEDYAFSDCSNLATITLNSNPYIIDNDVFPAGATVTMNLTANSADGAYWTTFYQENYRFKADTNTQVFKVTLYVDQLTMHEVANGIVDKNTAVVLKSTGNPVMTLTTSASSNTDDNNLVGVNDPAGKTSDGTMYVLNNGSKGVGFYKLTSGKTLGVGKAYLTYSGVTAPSFFGFGETTSIESIAKSQQPTANGPYYDLQGRRVAQPTKGLYIVNGKKVVIK